MFLSPQVIRTAFAALVPAALMLSCGSHPAATEVATVDGDDLLGSILQSSSLRGIVSNAAEHRLKVELAVVEGGPRGTSTLRRYSFDSGPEYFYPASSVKTCAAVAAAIQLRKLKAKNAVAVDLNTPMRFAPLFDGEVVETRDASHLADGTITLAHDMAKVFLVSDNAAYNRLYEFAGNAFVNETMRAAGLDSCRIFHRLSEFHTPEDQLRTPRVDLLGDGNRILATVPEKTSPFRESNADLSGTQIGRSHVAGGAVVDGPLSFDQKNYMHLRDLQDMQIMLLRPDITMKSATGRPRSLPIHQRDRAHIVELMAMTPRQSSDPHYSVLEYPDDYSKFLAQGVWTVIPQASSVVRDKVGRAYGFSTTNSEVTDLRTGKSFFLAATLYTNPNGVLNDSDYDYGVADQFFIDLGEAATRAIIGR